ncbi:hypothetical protein BGZ49_005201 [Haplosporangium sp. Z 27]|nr:hypothetical protein BGZ49_005201 [Haplosporangium sp. Z 27]
MRASSLWAASAFLALSSGVSAQVSVSPTVTPTTTPATTTATATSIATSSQIPPTQPTQLPFSQPLPLNPNFTDFTPRPNRTSPSFPDPEYVKLLDYSFLFYEAQRAGKLPANQRVKWRNDSVLTDGRDVGLNLTGGYFDAGDYLKFIFPLTFSLTETCYGALQFWEGYQLANQTVYLDEMVRWGMDWLINAHPNNNTLFVQIGLTDVDNNYWGPDTGVPLPRPSFQVNITNPGTDVMADAAAAFASCSILYRDKLNDTGYSNTLQAHATSLFNLAETAKPQQLYQVAVPEAGYAYASSAFIDELAWGAAWMYKLTQNGDYAQKASNYINIWNQQSIQTNPITWDDKSALVYILMADLTIGTPYNNSNWQSLAEQFGDFTLAAPKPCMYTKFGLYYCTGNSGDDTAVVAANAAFAMLLLADQMERAGGNTSSQTQAKIENYRDFAQKQNDYLLGNNPEKTPYVVGVHPNSPVNPHSASASGGNDIGAVNTSPEREEYTIYGALVGGPDKNDRFDDIRNDWRQTEVALDYNAPFNGLMAYQVMTSQLSPPYVEIPAGRPELPPILNGMEVWQIILIVVGSIFVIVAIGAFISYRRRDQIRAWQTARRQRKASKTMSKHSLRPMGTSIDSRRNASSLAVPSPPSLKAQQRSAPPSPPTQAQHRPPPPPPPSSTPQSQSTSRTQGRPVPPPPLPAREEPLLLQNARPS